MKRFLLCINQSAVSLAAATSNRQPVVFFLMQKLESNLIPQQEFSLQPSAATNLQDGKAQQ